MMKKEKKKLCCKYKLLWICHSSMYLTHYKKCHFYVQKPHLACEFMEYSSFIYPSCSRHLSPVPADLMLVLFQYWSHSKKSPDLKLLGAARQDPTGKKREILHPPAGWHWDKSLKSSRFLSDFSILVLDVNLEKSLEKMLCCSGLKKKFKKRKIEVKEVELLSLCHNHMLEN